MQPMRALYHYDVIEENKCYHRNWKSCMLRVSRSKITNLFTSPPTIKTRTNSTFVQYSSPRKAAGLYQCCPLKKGQKSTCNFLPIHVRWSFRNAFNNFLKFHCRFIITEYASGLVAMRWWFEKEKCHTSGHDATWRDRVSEKKFSMRFTLNVSLEMHCCIFI